MKKIRTAKQVAERVAATLNGDAFAILGPTRGTKADQRLRWLAMHIWMTQREPPFNYVQAGQAFGRDPTKVAVGVKRVRLERPWPLAEWKAALWPEHPILLNDAWRG